MTSMPDLDQMTPDQLRALAAQLLSKVDTMGRKSVSVRRTRLAWLNGRPLMRQQLRNLTRPLRRQASQNVLQISIRIMPVHARRLDQAHDRRCPFAAA